MPKTPRTASPDDRFGTTLSTMSGPSTASPPEPGALDARYEPLAARQRGTEALAAAVSANPLKASEFGVLAARGAPAREVEPIVGASTVRETSPSAKTGGALEGVRVDGTGQPLTTNEGVGISDNQNTLKAGVRGPALLEDFVLREKLTHFDHERIPERVVHARGSAAHGVFECTRDVTRLTMAAPFAKVGKQTPVFVRFSTVAGERGSADTARDVRGFAVKLYTNEGVWDLVGNNIPVFFIQDAMKFPDLIHSVKPEPHHQMPQASSAHDTFWDFVSLMPEATHTLMWVMSDRGIPRSYRTMQGFGVHTFRLVNAKHESVFCKFHWLPVAGTHSLVWDEAVRLAGVDSDFHRRDLWESIEAGAFPQYDLALQVFSEAQAATFSFDVLDATKLVPEELVPLEVVGRLTLNRNPDNFFAETEQVAFCTSHVIPGIDFSDDPLLAGRHHSYVDTQLTRLGGPNSHELPINASLAPVQNNQRDGLHRQAIHRGRANYEPNSLGGGCPFQLGASGFRPNPTVVEGVKVRGKPEKFADHYTQATLFWASQSPAEQRHIVKAFRFELTRVQTQAVRARVVSMLANVDPALAAGVAAGLGFEVPAPMPHATALKTRPEVERSAALSLLARPGSGVAGLRVAVLVAPGVEGAVLHAVSEAIVAAGAVPRFIGPQLGVMTTTDKVALHAEATFDTMPSVLFDAVVVPGGAAASGLVSDPAAMEFVRTQYLHCKTILVLGEGRHVLSRARILPDTDTRKDPGLILSEGDGTRVADFLRALATQRHFQREEAPLSP